MTADREPLMLPLIFSMGSDRLSSLTSHRLAASFLLSLKYKVVFLALLFLCLACSFAQAGQFKVVRVADGNTITIFQKGQKVRVRLVETDDPETSRSKRQPGQLYSQKSKEHLAGHRG